MNNAMLTGLKELGLREGACLLVHSSYKSLGSVDSIEEVVNTLKIAIGREGTLLFPALSFSFVNEDKPDFDIKSTPSCIGAIPEWFRQQPGVLRSMSPTHSVAAIGACAEEVTTGHDLDDTPVGANSPFRKLRDKGGQILMLGCGLRPNTSMHGVEELSQPPYLFKHDITYNCTDFEGKKRTITTRRHNFKNRHGEAIVQRYDRLRYILPKEVLKAGAVLDATCHLIEARPMWDMAEALIQQDPLFFVDGY